MNEKSINDVLNGSIHVDEEGVKRWEYTSCIPKSYLYMTQNEFAEFFDSVVTRIQKAANGWRD